VSLRDQLQVNAFHGVGRIAGLRRVVLAVHPHRRAHDPPDGPEAFRVADDMVRSAFANSLIVGLERIVADDWKLTPPSRRRPPAYQSRHLPMQEWPSL
jgi:hypothetical protein